MAELIEEYLKYQHKKDNKYLAPSYVKEKKELFINKYNCILHDWAIGEVQFPEYFWNWLEVHIDNKLTAIYSNWP